MAITTVATFLSAQQTVLVGDDLLITPTGGVVTTSAAITSSADFVNISNYGLVYSNNSAIAVTGQGARLTNIGTLEAIAGSPVITFGLTGELNRGLVINHGLILGSGNDADGIITQTGGNFIYNYGTIITHDDNAIQLSANFNPGSNSNYIFNSGVIQANSEVAIKTSQDNDTIRNEGTIDGSDTVAIDVNGGTDRVLNSGQIFGDVELGTGNDMYRGLVDGVVAGIVDAGDGDDTLIGSSADDHLFGSVNEDLLVGHDGDDTLDGGIGFDTLLGGNGDDFLDGGSARDTINGGAGSDELFGRQGTDILIGQDGSDTLDGGADNDTMDGGNGDDILEGGDDNDILRGRNGEDELAGGLGRDFLTGGQGADNFVFRALAETEVGANRDQILDFEQGLDLIVVAGLSPGVFEFRGTAAFDPSGNPELRLVETATGSTIVQFDADGNGTADAEIRVGGVTGLTADDFVL
jgi:serralysin